MTVVTAKLTFTRHMNLNEYAEKIEKAALTVSVCCCYKDNSLLIVRYHLLQTISEGKHVTGDLGGKASTKEYTQAIISKLTA